MPPPPRHDSNLSSSFTFETLVAGSSNQLGRAAALRIGLEPGTAYNPFLVYGASGLGKTHLMQAIGHEIVRNRPDARVMYLNSERYVAEMVGALQHGRIGQFKEFYRGLDALLIDDVQFFAGKDQTQEEFFHNFNALFEGGQQIVLTCDRYPKEVAGLEERLKTRFGWGLSVSIEPPELEMRVAILNSKAEQSGFDLPSEVSFFIAKQIRSNVRELEGALRRVLANAQLLGEPITLDFAKSALQDLVAVQARFVTIENIQKTVAEYYSIRLGGPVGQDPLALDRPAAPDRHGAGQGGDHQELPRDRAGVRRARPHDGAARGQEGGRAARHRREHRRGLREPAAHALVLTRTGTAEGRATRRPGRATAPPRWRSARGAVTNRLAGREACVRSRDSLWTARGQFSTPSGGPKRSTVRPQDANSIRAGVAHGVVNATCR